MYHIGLSIDPVELNIWASNPDSSYVASTQLSNVFAQIAAEVVKVGALDVVIQEVLNPDFKIVNVNITTFRSVDITNPQTLIWKADAVGAAGTETAILSFDIMHIDNIQGVKSVNQSIPYSDRQGAELNFLNPKVTINCSNSNIIEPCSPPTEFQIAGCQDAIITSANDTVISGLGRIVQVNAIVKNVCTRKTSICGSAFVRIGCTRYCLFSWYQNIAYSTTN